jgi:hypothetical protein
MKGTNGSLEALGDRKTCFDFLGDLFSSKKEEEEKGGTSFLGSCLSGR